MVKLPSLDELKKMGSGLMDSAKSVNFGEMVDKVKSGIDSVSSKKAPLEVPGDEALTAVLQGISTCLNELNQAQAAQASAMKKMEKQLAALVTIVAAYQAIDANDANDAKTEPTKEDDKPNE